MKTKHFQILRFAQNDNYFFLRFAQNDKFYLYLY